MVRTSAFHAGNQGSIPCRSTKYKRSKKNDTNYPNYNLEHPSFCSNPILPWVCRRWCYSSMWRYHVSFPHIPEKEGTAQRIPDQKEMYGMYGRFRFRRGRMHNGNLPLVYLPIRHKSKKDKRRWRENTMNKIYLKIPLLFYNSII